MAHVHGAGEAMKSAASHAAKGQGAGMMGMMGSMSGMMESMPGMMGPMAGQMGEMMVREGGHRMAGMATGAAAAGVAAAAAKSSGGFMSTLTRHPLVVFGLGLATGYLIHKYRKEIIAGATRIGEQGKDFVLHQKENLEDLVAECKECADDAGKPEKD